MRSFLEHFAFMVFLFAYISHYFANAEICMYPALLVSAIRVNFYRLTVYWCVCSAQSADCWAAPVSLCLLSLNTWGRPEIIVSNTRMKTGTSYVTLTWRKKVQGQFVPLSQRFVMNIVKIYPRSYSNQSCLTVFDCYQFGSAKSLYLCCEWIAINFEES